MANVGSNQITYLFIDGGYIRRVHAAAMQKVFGVPGDLMPERIAEAAQAFRSYFYDCEDVLRPGESHADFETRIQPQREYFARIRALRGFHLQVGTMRSGKKREQKEVDVLLAVDMLTHGFNRNLTRAVLVTGDLDFRPVVEALVRGGIFVEVWYEKSSTSAELPFAADFGYELTWAQLYQWNSREFLSKYKTPSQHIGGSLPPSAMQISKGQFDRYPVELCEIDGGRGLILIAYFGNEVSFFGHTDRTILEGYFSVLHGPITWTSENRLRF